MQKKEKQILILMIGFLEKSFIYLLEHYYLQNAVPLSTAPLNTTLLNH